MRGNKYGSRKRTDQEMIRDFWEKVTCSRDTSNCWLFEGTLTEGYGYCQFEGRVQRANRISWKLFYGSIPPGIMVCHHCDVRNCVNPNHLFLGTQSDNMKDAFRKGRISRKGTKHPRSRLSDDDVLFIRKSKQGGVPMKDLACRYGLRYGTIKDIVYGKAWSHLPVLHAPSCSKDLPTTP